MKNTYMIGGLVVAGLIGAGGLIWFTGSGNTLLQPGKNDTTEDASAAVATIHGGQTTITRAQLDAQIATLANNPQIRVPATDKMEERAQFERLVLDQMVRDILLFEQAQKEGATANDADVDAELAAITAKYENTAAFEQAVAAAKLDTESLRENIRHQLIVTQYYTQVAAEHPATTTPEEVRAFFDEQIAPQQTASTTVSFEELAAQIQAHLEQQKTQQVLDGIIDELYRSADVKLLI